MRGMKGRFSLIVQSNNAFWVFRTTQHAILPMYHDQLLFIHLVFVRTLEGRVNLRFSTLLVMCSAYLALQRVRFLPSLFWDFACSNGFRG